MELPEDEESHSSWTGKQIWRSSVLLADWLASHPSLLCGREVLELGCGAAPLPSALAALCGAAEVVATDGDQTAVMMAARNLQQCDGAWGTRRLDWAKPASALKGRFSVILFADAVYTEPAARALAHCISHCLSSDARSEVYGALGERRVGASLFFSQMRVQGFVAEQIALPCSVDCVTQLEGCTRQEALREQGQVVLVRWRRAARVERADDGPRLAAMFDSALADAERQVEQNIFNATGYLAEE